MCTLALLHALRTGSFAAPNPAPPSQLSWWAPLLSGELLIAQLELLELRLGSGNRAWLSWKHPMLPSPQGEPMLYLLPTEDTRGDT